MDSHGRSLAPAAAETAVALVTRLAASPDVPAGELLDGADLAGVAVATVIIDWSILAGVLPADEGMRALARLGEALADAEDGNR